MKRRWLIWLLPAAVATVVAGAVWRTLSLERTMPKPVGMKNLSETVAEGVSYRSWGDKFPRVACDACRVGKKKIGMLSLGAFNTLELDNLVINIPTNENLNAERTIGRSVSEAERETGRPGKDAAPEIIDSFGLKPLMEMAQSGLEKSFSGVCVNKFTLNRVTESGLDTAISAERLRTSGKDVILQNVIVNRNGERISLKTARLKLKPKMTIVWSDGALDVADIVR